MNHKITDNFMIKAFSQTGNEQPRNVNPMDINLPPEYRIEAYVIGLDSPIGMVFSEEGDLYIADSGSASGDPKVIRLTDGRFEIISNKFHSPITGINYFDEKVYVSNKGCITVLHLNGAKQDIIAGLPCNGDFGISNVAFGPDGKIYFGMGTATNSGVVGLDNEWVFDHPLLHDVPPIDLMVNGQNYETENMLISNKEKAYTGAFASFGVQNIPNQVKRGVKKASGSILKANRDGTELELVAWGFRNPVHMKYDRDFRLFVSNRSYDVRGSRPVANAPDEFCLVTPGLWYGWPDYSAGEPLTMPKFMPEGGSQPQFILTNHPNIPPKPYAEFPPHSSILGFDFNYNDDFGPYGDVFMAEFGSYGPITMGQSAPYVGIGHRISRINMSTGEISTFINNKSGLPAYIDKGGGFGRLVDVKFGPDGAMYLLDMGMNDRDNPVKILPNSGVIWRVIRAF